MVHERELMKHGDPEVRSLPVFIYLFIYFIIFKKASYRQELTHSLSSKYYFIYFHTYDIIYNKLLFSFLTDQHTRKARNLLSFGFYVKLIKLTF